MISSNAQREFRVYGPPGTGKTTYLAEQIDRAVDKTGEDRIVVASFTRAAAIEIASRGVAIPREHIGTLHALCFHALGRPVIAESKLKEWNESGGARSYYQMSGDGDGDGADTDDPYVQSEKSLPGDELLALYNRLRAHLAPEDTWPQHVRKFAQVWEEWKTANDFLDFTDLLMVAHRDLDHAPGDPQIGFLDEAQDCTRLQLALWRKWALSMDFTVLAGDADQCIYRFIGATPDAFLEPPVTPEHRRVQGQSNRIPRAVHRMTVSWIEQCAYREQVTYLPRDAEGMVTRLPIPYTRPELVVRDMEGFLRQGQTLMVLASCAYMLRPLLAVLKEGGLPFHNPYRRRRGDWNPLHPRRGVSAREKMLAYLKPYGLFDIPVLEWMADPAFCWTGAEMKRWMGGLQVKGVLRSGVKTHLEEKIQDDQKMALEAIYALFETDIVPEMLKIAPAWLVEHSEPKLQRGLGYTAAIVEKSGYGVLERAPQIIAGTIHSVKGGEADRVYLFPDLSYAGAREWAQHGEARDSVIRLMYVGMTRARESLVLCEPASPLGVQW